MTNKAPCEQGLALYRSLKIFIALMSAVLALEAASAHGREGRPPGSRPARGNRAAAAGEPGADPPAPATAAGAGSSLFRKYCQRCHEADGSGQRDRLPEIPDFRDPAWHRGRNDFQLTASILDGKGTRMPAFQERLHDRQVQELVQYLRCLAPAGPAPGRPAANSTGDFERRFDQLRRELRDLQRQFNELSDR
jgi:mono/diheme cytochrome c family protein